MQKYMCKVCGAELFWDPQAGSLKCKYCDTEFQPTDFEDHTLNEEQKDESLDATYTNAGAEIGSDMVVYQCKTCLAEVVTSKTTMATTCAYCGNAISITNKSAGKFRPEIVIPYAITKEQAQEIYKKYVSKSFLTPKSFKENNKVDKMQGLYVPFWLHSMNTHAQARFECEKHSHSRRGNDRVTTHKVYNVYVDANGIYENVPTDGAKKLDDTLMDALEPFNYKKLTAYNPAYMAGFFSEQPDEAKEETVPRAKQRISKSMLDQMSQTAGHYDQKRNTGFNANFSNEKVAYAMLPVWMMNVSHNGKNYQFAINGDTGKVVGKLPMSIGKLALMTAGSGLAVQLIMMILRVIGIL